MANTPDKTGVLITELVAPEWFEIAVPVPGSTDRALIWTGPLTVDGVAAAMAALSPYQSQHRLDGFITEFCQAHTKNTKRPKS
jgi:hypothetical protein